MVVALALDAAGVDRDTIVSDYLATRERIEAIMARLMSSSTYRAELEGHDPQHHAPVPGTMERLLEIVDRALRWAGGVARRRTDWTRQTWSDSGAGWRRPGRDRRGAEPAA